MNSTPDVMALAGTTAGVVTVKFGDLSESGKEKHFVIVVPPPPTTTVFCFRHSVCLEV